MILVIPNLRLKRASIYLSLLKSFDITKQSVDDNIYIYIYIYIQVCVCVEKNLEKDIELMYRFNSHIFIYMWQPGILGVA